MPKTPRPAFTYIASVFAVVGAIWMEFATMDEPEMGGATFWLFAPVLVLGYGFDWIRLERPGALQVAWALMLSAASMDIVIYGMVHDWLPTVLSSAAAGALLIALRWTLASISPRAMVGTFIGRQDGRWLFAAGEQSWALESEAPLEVTLGRRYAFLAKLKENRIKSAGPYRRTPHAHGRLVDIASHPRVFVERRHERAWNDSRGVLRAMALITVALVLPHLEF